MTMFEYIAIANSLILTLAVVRLIDALPSTFDRKRQYWTHSIFVVNAIVASVHYWWGAWRFAGVSSWSQWDFLLFLAPPAILYAIARTLSSPHPTEVESFRDHFFAVRTRFFALSSTYQLMLALTGRFTLGIPLTHPFRVLQGGVILALASGMLTTNPAYLAVLAVVSLIALAVTFAMLPQGGAPTAIQSGAWSALEALLGAAEPLVR